MYSYLLHVIFSFIITLFPFDLRDFILILNAILSQGDSIRTSWPAVVLNTNTTFLYFSHWESVCKLIKMIKHANFSENHLSYFFLIRVHQTCRTQVLQCTWTVDIVYKFTEKFEKPPFSDDIDINTHYSINIIQTNVSCSSTCCKIKIPHKYWANLYIFSIFQPLTHEISILRKWFELDAATDLVLTMCTYMYMRCNVIQ